MPDIEATETQEPETTSEPGTQTEVGLEEGTTPESEKILGKYDSMEEAEEGVRNLVETLDDLKSRDGESSETIKGLQNQIQSLTGVLQNLQGGRGPDGKSPSGENDLSPSERKQKFIETWNQGSHEDALKMVLDPVIQPLIRRIEELTGKVGGAQMESVLRRFDGDKRFPRLKELMPVMDRTAAERLQADPDYHKSFKTQEDAVMSLYAEAAFRNPNGARPEPKKGALLASLPPGSSRRAPGRAPAKPELPELDKDLMRKLGVKVHPRQNRPAPGMSRIMEETAAIERLEDEAAQT